MNFDQKINQRLPFSEIDCYHHHCFETISLQTAILIIRSFQGQFKLEDLRISQNYKIDFNARLDLIIQTAYFD